MHSSDSTPLRGREAEYATISTFLQDRLRMEHSRILFVCGPCGAGKSCTVIRAAKSSTMVHLDPPSWAQQQQQQQPSASPTAMAPRRPSAVRQAKEGELQVRRALQVHYVNCADQSAEQLRTELIRLLWVGARVSSSQGGKVKARLTFLENLIRGLPSSSTATATSRGSRTTSRTAPASHSLPYDTALTVRNLNTLPLHVFVLDEADFAKKGASVFLRHVAEMIIEHPMLLGAIFVSNSRELPFLPMEWVSSLPFVAYGEAQLRQIAEGAVKDAGEAFQGTGGVTLTTSAFDFAVKTVSNTHLGDARKMIDVCRAAIGRAAKKKRQRGDDDAVVVVGLQDTAAVVMGTTPNAAAWIASLPELATYLLCCMLVIAKRKAKENAVSAVSIGGVGTVSGGGGHRSVGGSVKARQQSSVAQCGTMTFTEVRGLYMSLMQQLMFPISSVESLQRSVEELHSAGVITGSQAFCFSSQWRMGEIENALVAKGQALVTEEEKAMGVESGANRFRDALEKLSGVGGQR